MDERKRVKELPVHEAPFLALPLLLLEQLFRCLDLAFNLTSSPSVVHHFALVLSALISLPLELRFEQGTFLSISSLAEVSSAVF